MTGRTTIRSGRNIGGGTAVDPGGVSQVRKERLRKRAIARRAAEQGGNVGRRVAGKAASDGGHLEYEVGPGSGEGLEVIDVAADLVERQRRPCLAVPAGETGTKDEDGFRSEAFRFGAAASTA